MSTYAEYLKANGATDEDLKVLVTPVTEKAFAAQVKAVADAQAKITASEAQTRKWYDDQVVPNMTALQKKADAAAMREAAAIAQLKVAQEAGLIEVAATQDGIKPAAAATTPDFDASKYVTNDTLMQVAQQEGDAIAIAQDIAAEHSILFPGQRLSFRDLRKDAVARKVSVEQVWREKYNVDAARETKSATDKAAYEAKLRNEGAEEARKKFAETSGVNPALGFAQPSRTPFTGRNPAATTSADGNKIVHPWDRTDAEREQARQAPVVQRLVAQA